MSDISENGIVRTAKKSLLCNDESGKKKKKFLRIYFSRTLEIYQRLATILGAFIQVNWLNVSKNSELCDISQAVVPSSSPQLHGNLEI